MTTLTLIPTKNSKYHHNIGFYDLLDNPISTNTFSHLAESVANNNNTVTCTPLYIDNNNQDHWVNDTTPKIVLKSYLVQTQTTNLRNNFTFSGDIFSNTLVNPYTSLATHKYNTFEFQAIIIAYNSSGTVLGSILSSQLNTGDQFSVSLDTKTTTFTTIAKLQWGFVLTGFPIHESLGYLGGGSVVITPPPIPISNICFPAKTPITTDQGKIFIENINPEIHTIRKKKIVTITKTITPDKYLVCFEKDSLGKNTPSQKTIISKNHSLFYKGQMIKAKNFINQFENVKKIKYTGEILYNVLLESYDKMIVNNLICETLHPENSIAKLYKVLQTLTVEEQYDLIRRVNEYAIKNKVYTSKKLIK